MGGSRFELIPTAAGAVVAMAGALSALMGGVDEVFKTLMVLVAADIVTGWARAVMQGQLWSRRAFVGGLQKLMIFVVIGVATALDRYIGGTGDPAILRAGACMFYIATEGVSVIENLGELGVPVPDQIAGALARLKGVERR